jgi:hypothetical protein
MDYVKLARQVARGASEDAPSIACRLDSRDATKATEATKGGEALLVDSRILGEAVWLVEDEAHADEFERDLAAEGDSGLLVFTVAEVLALEGMLRRDLETVLAVKRHLGGRVASVKRSGRGSRR